MSFSSSSIKYWRLLHAVGLLLAMGMLGGALYLQIEEFVMPCLFCVYLRLLSILYSATALLALLSDPQRQRQKIYSALLLLYSLLGIAVSGYLLNIQMQPSSDGGSCGQGAGASLVHWPLGEMWVLLFSSYGNCAEVPWQWFGLTLPMLSLLGFISLFLLEIGKRRFWRQFFS